MKWRRDFFDVGDHVRTKDLPLRWGVIEEIHDDLAKVRWFNRRGKSWVHFYKLVRVAGKRPKKEENR
jgi:hypothetical protein